MKTVKSALKIKYEYNSDNESEVKIRDVFNLLFNKIKSDYQFETLTLILFVEKEGGEYIQYPLDSDEDNRSFVLTTKSNVTMINLN